jgi:hypothetical protein
MASLPRQCYQRVFEPACANGELSALLAERCADLLCQDLDATAVAWPRAACTGTQCLGGTGPVTYRTGRAGALT